MKSRERIHYHCGCGFKSNKKVEAEKHIQQTGHSITVSGTVRPVEAGSRAEETDATQTTKNLPVVSLSGTLGGLD